MSLIPTHDQFPEFPVVPVPAVINTVESDMAVLTPEKLKAKFLREGKTFKAFAEQHGYPYCEVVRVVNGINKARRGRGHCYCSASGAQRSHHRNGLIVQHNPVPVIHS